MNDITIELNGTPDYASDTDGINFTYANPSHPVHARLFIRAIERVSGQRELKRLYCLNRAAPRPGEDFYAAAIRLMRLDVRVDERAFASIPRSGPLLFVANHPYGVLDGLVLAWLARTARPGAKLLAHSLLCQADETADSLLPIDFSGTPEARATSVRSRMQAQDWLRRGEALAIFPGGSVATCPSPLSGPAAEFPWHPFVAKLIRACNATVVPVCIRGQNSRLFQLASHIHYALRLSLLFHETARRLGTAVEVGIGDPIQPEDLGPLSERETAMLELRRRTYAVGRALWPGDAAFHDHRRSFAFPAHIDPD